MVNSSIVFFVAGYVFYAGYCIGEDAIPNDYTWMYFVFLFIFCASYNFSYKLLHGVGRDSGTYFGDFLRKTFDRRVNFIIISSYLLLSIAPLFYPEFRIIQLFNPPTPDLAKAFGMRFEEVNNGVFIGLALLMKQLITPFFYISLYNSSRRILIPFLVLSVVFYIEYVVSGYKSRGQLIVHYFPLLFYYWCSYPRRRMSLVFLGVSSLPFMMLAFHFYENYRLDSSVSFGAFDVVTSIDHILRSETGFVEFVGLPLMDSGARVDFVAYIKWIFTLPFPKFIIGEVSGARINTEISEIILGLERGSRGFYIVLPGLISEAVYIYGPYLYWVHALTLGFLFSFLIRIFRGNKEFTFLIGYAIGLAIYNLNRGGVASFLPQVINQFFLMYVILLFYMLGIIRVSPRGNFGSSARLQ